MPRILRGWVADLKFALRLTAKNPWMSAASIVSLGGAMAVTIGAFSLLWGSYYASLPFPNADRIVAIRDIDPESANYTAPTLPVYREWAARSTTLDVVGATYTRQRDIADGSGGLVRYPVAAITPSGFALAGVAPVMGRTLTADDQRPGAPKVVVIGSRVWKALFGSSPSVVGSTITVDGEALEIVGVMPEGFRFPYSDDLWVPLDPNPARSGGVDPKWLGVFGRLSPGTTMAQATAELDTIRAGFETDRGGDRAARERRTLVLPYVKGDTEAGLESAFQLSFFFVLLVLVVACASVANLLLARAAARRSEIAVRAAMGASRARIVRQLCIEALVLTSAGAVLGVTAASLGLSWFGTYVPLENRPFWFEFGMSLPTVVFAVAAAFGAAVVSGVAPALKVTGRSMGEALKDNSRGSSGVRFGSISGALTVAEVALSVAFLAAAGLAARSFVDASSSASRLPADRVLVADVTLVDDVSEDASGRLIVADGEIPAEQWLAKAEELREAVAGLPGVESVVLADRLPAQQHGATRIEFEEAPGGEPPEGVRVLSAVASPELFPTFGGSIIAGRGLESGDRAGAEPVAVVNRQFADRFFAGANPVGARFRDAGGSDRPWLRIVGIAAGLPMNPSGDRQPGFYRPFAQVQETSFTLAVRTAGAPLSLSGAVKQAAARVDSRIDIANFETHEESARRYRANYTMMGMMFAALGGTALFLAVAGLYAVMSFAVAQRTREIGIRVALGADRHGVMRVVLGRGVAQIAVGVAVGAIGGAGLMRLIAVIPIGMAAGGPSLVASAAGLMLAAGLAASAVPAARALRIHPVEALRHD